MVSVIVPFYNAEQWLERCLHSLVIQDDAEFILVDDNSTDNGIEIAYDYCNRDQRFTLLRNHNLRGVSGARNTGLQIAKGDYITFLDADDELLPNAIRIYNNLNEHNIYQANHLRHYPSINKTARKYTNNTGWYNLSDMPKQWCYVWNKLYKREFIKGITFKEIMNYGEDELFNLECLKRDKNIYCVEADTCIKHFDNDHSLARSKEAADIFKQADELTKFIKRTNDAELRRFVCRLLASHWGSDTYLKVIAPLVADKK